MAGKRVQTFYRMVKAATGHPFAGLYAVEKLRYKDNVLVKSEIVHEWDLRIISESILARLGGQDAFDNYIEDSGTEAPEEQCIVPAAPRTAEELEDLTARKLKKEFVGPSRKEK